MVFEQDLQGPHCIASLLQDRRAKVEDPALVAHLALFHHRLVRKEGVPLTVEREQHAELPVEGLQQVELEQPAKPSLDMQKR